MEDHKRKGESPNDDTDDEEVSSDFVGNVVEHDAELPQSPELSDPARNEDKLDPTQADANSNDPPQDIRSLLSPVNGNVLSLAISLI